MDEKYIINKETSALISYFHNGYEYSQVIEGKHMFTVRQSPDKIVSASFSAYWVYFEGCDRIGEINFEEKL